MTHRSSSDAAQVQDLWSKLLQQKEEQKLAVSDDNTEKEGKEAGAAKPGREAYVLFVGDKQAGKSTLVTQFLNPNKEDKPKPTVALEYTFGRRSNTTTQKDIAHIWELAGGTKVSQLIAVPITPERLPTAVVAIVIDMSKPGDAITSLVRWTRKIKGQVDSCMKQLKSSKNGSALFELITASARERNKQADAEALCPVPLLIFATKYDLFETQDGVARKTAQNALRYIAHAYGATVLSIAPGKKPLMAMYRSMMNHFVFATPSKSSTVANDPTKPLVLPSGADSLEGIGMPKGTRPSEFEAMGLDKRLELWQDAVLEFFPQTQAGAVGDLGDDAGEDGKEGESAHTAGDSAHFREPVVDQMRAQKDDELLRYRREVERRVKLEGSAAKSHKSSAPGVAEKKSRKKERSSAKSQSK